MAENDERIETYVNRNGIQGDTDFFLAKLNELDEAFARVNNTKLSLGKDNSFKLAIDDAGKLTQATKGLATTVDNYKAIQAEANQILQQGAAAAGSSSEAALKQANSLATLRLALQQNAALQKEYKKQLDDGALSLEQYQTKTGEAIVKQKEYQASIAALNKELNTSAKASTSKQGPAGPTVLLTDNSGALEAEQAAIERTGEAVSELEKKQALAVVEAKEWAAAQLAAGSAAETAAAAQAIPLTQLEETALLFLKQRSALSLLEIEQAGYYTQLTEGLITQEEYNALMAKSIIQQTELKASVSALNKELSLAAKADLATPGSIRAAQAENLQLINERSGITAKQGLATPEDLERIKELNALIDANNELIDANSSKLEKQKINIGNYPTVFTQAFGTLETELNRVNTALLQPGLNGNEIAGLTLKQTALKNAISLVGQEFSSTTAQTNAYKEAAKQVGQVYGTNSELFKAFSGHVAEGAAQTKKIGEELEKAGGKTNAFKNGLQSIYGSLRQIAQAIPGIGIAGLIGLLLDPLVTLGASLFNIGSKSIDTADKVAVLKDQLKKTDEVLEGLGSTAGKGVLEVDNLRVHIDQAKLGLISQNDVVELYNSTIGKTTGSVNSLAEAEQGLIDHGAAYIKFTFLKAAAQVAATKASDEAVQAEITRQKNLKDFSNISDGRVTAYGSTTFNAAEYDRETARIEQARKERQAKEAKVHDDAAATYLAVEKTFLDQLNALSKDNNFNPDGDKIKEANEKSIRDLEVQIQALTRYENKQNEVAETETNTYEKRRQAIIKYNNAAAKLVELNSLKSFIGVTNTNQQDQLAAKLLTDQEKTAQDGYKRLHALDEAYRLRKLTAEEQLAEDQINQVVKANEAVYKNDQKSLEERLAAYKAFIEAQAHLLDVQKTEKLATAGFSQQEIANFNSGLQVQLQGKKITNEELLALQADYQTKVIALNSQVGKEVHDIALSWAKKEQQDVDDLLKRNQDSSSADKYLADVEALNNAYDQKIISTTKYQRRKEALDKQFAISQLQQQVEDDRRALTAEDRYDKELTDGIESAMTDLFNARESGNQEEIDVNQAKLDALLKAEGDSSAKVLAIRKKLANDTAALVKKEGDDEKANIEKRRKEIENIVGEVAKYTQQALSIIEKIENSRYDNESKRIQNSIDEINARAQTDIDAENATSDNAQQKAKVIADIQGRAAAQTKQLQDDQKRLDVAKAKFDKEKAIADIIINTAVAISKSLGKPWEIAAIAAIGAAEIAIVAAQPLPHYKYGAGVNGRPKHPGGDAEVGHGKPELAITPQGRMIVTPSIPTVMSFPRDTTVLPDANAAIDALIYSSLTSVERAHMIAPDDRVLQATNQLIRENRRLQQIIANKKETHINGSWAGLEVMFRSGYNWMKWVDGNTNFMGRKK
jgi:hypothetical protein